MTVSLLPDERRPAAGSYSGADLRCWAGGVGEWSAAGQDVPVHVDNDGYGHAVRNAERLRALTGSRGGARR